MLSITIILICLHLAIGVPNYKTSSRNIQREDVEDVGSPLFLSPYIEQNKLEEAREAAAVESDVLPSGIDSYAGYLTVNKEYNSNLWFWYFPVMDQPVEDTPWMIWLQGGPGYSSMLGLFTEIGPYAITNDNQLEEIMYSWGKNHSLLFIDNPLGTGYSFTDDDRGYATNEKAIGESLYEGLQQFLTMFPELRKAPLTIAGEEYAGKYIPALGVEIMRHKNDGAPINLHGVAIGNGYIDPITLQGLNKVVREVGLVDDRVADIIEKVEESIVECIKNGEITKTFWYHQDILDLITRTANVTNQNNYLAEEVYSHYDEFVQQPDLRRALHVGNRNFSDGDYVYDKLVPEYLGSVKPLLEEFLENYKVLVYSGPLDLIVPYKPSVNTYESLSYSGASEYRNAKREPWYHNGIIAGYARKGGNLLEVMVRGAGLAVPADKPAQALALISAFVRDISLDEDTGYLVPAKNTLTPQ